MKCHFICSCLFPLITPFPSFSGSSSHEITHTVFLVGDAANLRCSLIGKRVEGIWRRGQGNEGREGAGGNVDVDSVVVLLKDFATGRHLPVRGIPFMISGDEVGFAPPLSFFQ